MRKDDVAFTASLHRTELPHGFFPTLGEAYLRAYHRTYITSPHGMALIAEVAGRPCGFLVGTLRHGEHHRFVVRAHGMRLTFAAMRAMARRPALAAHFASTRLPRYVRGLVNHLRPASPPSHVGERATASGSATLSHVAVHPDQRVRGAGALLVHGFADSARAAGTCSMVLSTLAEGQGASDFYARLGWSARGGYVDRDGRVWVRMVQLL